MSNRPWLNARTRSIPGSAHYQDGGTLPRTKLALYHTRILSDWIGLTPCRPGGETYSSIYPEPTALAEDRCCTSQAHVVALGHVQATFPSDYRGEGIGTKKRTRMNNLPGT